MSSRRLTPPTATSSGNTAIRCPPRLRSGTIWVSASAASRSPASISTRPYPSRVIHRIGNGGGRTHVGQFADTLYACGIDNVVLLRHQNDFQLLDVGRQVRRPGRLRHPTARSRRRRALGAVHISTDRLASVEREWERADR